MNDDLVVAVDLGTTGLKVLVFDAVGAPRKTLYYPFTNSDNWIEQKPSDWWTALVRLLRRLPRRTVEMAKAVAISAQSGTLLPIDSEGKVIHNASTWLDPRPFDEAEQIRKMLGGSMSTALLEAKVLWFKRNRSEIFMRTDKFLRPADFLTYKLSGNAVTDYCNASCATKSFVVEDHEWSSQTLEKLGIDRKLLPDPIAPTKVAGEVTKIASRQTGLTAGLPVVCTGVDAFLAMIGSGAIAQGQVCDVSGTGTTILTVLKSKVADPEAVVPVMYHPILESWILMGVSPTSGLVVDWALKFLQGKRGREHDYHKLNSKTLTSGPGANGLLFLPYLLGAKSPLWLPKARGLVFGLTPATSEADFLRSVLEGVAYDLRLNLSHFERLGAVVEEIRLCGGAAKNEAWNQIKADITGHRTTRLEVTEATALGAAMVGFIAIGHYHSLNECSREMVHLYKTFNPDLTLKRKYDQAFKKYTEICQLLKSLKD